MTEEGSFPEHHHYVGGKCEYCGAKDPDGGATEPPKPEEDPETKPEEGGETADEETP